MAALALVAVSGTWAMAHLRTIGRIPEPPAAAAIGLPDINPAAMDFDASAFKALPDPGGSAVQDSTCAGRFRLAGTFFAVGLRQQARKAILDDLRKKEQLLVNEGDRIENDILVVAIKADRIILNAGGKDEEIPLTFAGAAPAGAAAQGDGRADGRQAEAPNRFGKQVGDARWVMSRSELLNYYNELLNNTDRLAKMYDSLKPVYQNRQIAGYTLDIEGESDAFRAFGLRQGDVIRQVNSMPMTSQSRAEYFIREFVKNRVNGFVLEIEREGKAQRLIYMVR